MERKSGKGKALVIILIVIIVLLLLGGGGFFAWYYFTQMNKPPVVVKLYEDYVEGQDFEDEEFESEELTPLPENLTEYKNEELGVRFGYIKGMVVPEDEVSEEDVYISTATHPSNSTVVQLRVGKIDTSQLDLDHIQKQREALVQELIKSETYTVIEKVNGKDVERTIVPTADQVSPIKVTYRIMSGQLGVKFSYTEKGKTCTRIITIKDEMMYSLTYKAEQADYSYADEEKIYNSFEFIDKIDNRKATDLNKIIINGKEYNLPLKFANFENLTLDGKYASQLINPNYYTIVSLYENQVPKYSAYMYNAKACRNAIENGYITAISTDVDRGGNIEIYKGIKLGTTYAEVKDALGRPSRQYYSEDRSVLTNVYTISGVTFELKLRNDDMVTRPDDSTANTAKVIAILIKVSK